MTTTETNASFSITECMLCFLHLWIANASKRGESKGNEVSGGRKVSRITMRRDSSHKLKIKCEAPAVTLRPTEVTKFMTELFIVIKVVKNRFLAV